MVAAGRRGGVGDGNTGEQDASETGVEEDIYVVLGVNRGLQFT